MIREAPHVTRVELGLGGSIIKRMRDLGATAIYTPTELRASTSRNLATGKKALVTGYGLSDYVTTEYLLDAYPATYAGSPTRGVRGTLPEGRMAATLDGTSQSMSVSAVVGTPSTLVTFWSPFTSRLNGFTMVVLFKGGNAGEPLMVRTGPSSAREFGLYTDALERSDVRTGGDVTFADTSDATNWVLVVATYFGGFGGPGAPSVYVNRVARSLAGSLAPTPYQGFANDGGTLYIGRNGDGTDFFTGTIALAAFLPRHVSQAEAEALYDATQWTDVTADLAGWSALDCEYGLPGDRPDDVVARTGELALTLRNSAVNSAKTEGYYSPGHASCRAGFRVGIPIRYSLGYYDQTYYKFRGRVDRIEPAAGLQGALGTRVVAVDWMEEAATSPMPKIGTETNLRYDEALEILLDGMAPPPAFVNFADGRDEFPYVFDSAPSSNSPAIGEIARLVRSERGFFYPVGDLTGGGTIVSEHRHSRALSDTIEATIDNTMFELQAGRSRKDIVTSVTVTIHPRRIDAAATTVLYEIDNAIKPRIGPGETIQWRAGYRDPDSPIARIGGTNIVTPVANTDYVMNTAEDGSGANVTASMTVEFQHAGVYGVFTITNTTATDAYVQTLQIRGKGLYQYADLLCKSEDAGALVEYGENHVALDMAYQTDPQVGQGVADWVRAIWSQETTGVSRLSFLANSSMALMLAALAVEPGQGVVVREDVTAVADEDDLPNYYVHRVRYSQTDGDILRVTWTLAPADRERFWILDEPGRSELDETTRLAYA